MIGLVSQNNILKSSLLDILSDLSVESFTPDHNYEALLVAEEDLIALSVSVPLITLGISLPNEVLHIQTPIRPDDLIEKIGTFLTTQQAQKTFENDTFIFQKTHRCLITKKDNTRTLLTEKENDLLAALANAYPTPLGKEQLLEQVWNYKPDIETHTLESHIYGLRQKLGDRADNLIKSTSNGYLLVGPASDQSA